MIEVGWAHLLRSMRYDITDFILPFPCVMAGFISMCIKQPAWLKRRAENQRVVANIQTISKRLHTIPVHSLRNSKIAQFRGK